MLHGSSELTCGLTAPTFHDCAVHVRACSQMTNAPVPSVPTYPPTHIDHVVDGVLQNVMHEPDHLQAAANNECVCTMHVRTYQI